MPSPCRRKSPRRRSRSRSRARSTSGSKRRSKSKSRSRSSPRRYTHRRYTTTQRKPSTQRKSRSDNKPKSKGTSRRLSSKKTCSCQLASKGCEECPKKRRSYGGPAGSFVLIFVMPLIVYAVNLACGRDKCDFSKLPNLPHYSYFFDVEATLMVLGWIFFQMVISLIPVGKVYEGQQLKSGTTLTYRCNGVYAVLATFIAFGAAVYYNLPVSILYGKFMKLMTASVIFTIFLSKLMYIKSRFVASSKLSPRGNTGNVVYDFFVGHELNPRIGPLDLKFFFELRPGLLGWLMMNLAFIRKAYMDTGAFPPELTMVAFFQIWYVVDALIYEESILATVNIVKDGFGYLQIFCDLVLVPFFYTLQTRFLLNHPPGLPRNALAGIALLYVVGYIIFRGSVSQRNKFKKNPQNPNADFQTIAISTNKNLLVSGWWSMCRKPNYLGDLLMSFSWSLACGLNPLTYCYPVFFLILLVYRERVESVGLKKKYGSCWDRYTHLVKYRIFPFIY